MTTFAYTAEAPGDLAHELVSVTGPNAQTGGPDAGDAFTVSYDGSGRATAETSPTGAETSFNYGGMTAGTGDVVVTDANGVETEDDYSGSVATSSTADYGGSAPATTTYGPDFSTLDTEELVDPDSDESGYGYDSNGNRTTATSPLSETSSSYDDSADQPLCTSTPMAALPSSPAYPGDVCASLAAAGSFSQTPDTAGTTLPAAPAPSGSGAPPPYVTYYRYDSDGDLVWTETGIWQGSESEASAERVTYTLYHGESVTPAGGSEASCTVDPAPTDLPCATVSPTGTVVQLAYGSDGDLTSSTVVDANGSADATTTHTFDADGEVTSTTSPLGNVSGADAALYTTTTSYDGAGEATGTSTGLVGSVLGTTTAIAHDPDGNATAQTDALGATTTTSYDADDRPTLVTDPDGDATLTCYDGTGRPVATVPPDGTGTLTPASCRTSSPWGLAGPPADATTTAYSFGSPGPVVTTQTPAPAGLSGTETTTQFYDAAGRLVETASPPLDVPSGDESLTVDTYDEDGHLLSQTTGLSLAPDGTVAEVSGSVATASTCYDQDGEATETVPGLGNTGATVSSAGAVTGYVCASGGTTSSGYATTYVYDSVGDQLTTTVPLTTSTSATTTDTYRADGTLATSEGPSGSARTTTTDAYEPDGQLASETYSPSEPEVSFSYDVAGDRLSMDDASGTSTYQYDPAGELASTTDGNGDTVEYGYDADGDVTAVGYPLGPDDSWASDDTVNSRFDAAGNLTAVSDFAGNVVAYGYDADGLPTTENLPTTTTPDTVTTSYDDADGVSAISLAPTGDSSDVALGFSYSDEPTGAVESETDTPTESYAPADYEYDASGRVTQMAPGSGSLGYGYDASGDLTGPPDGESAAYDLAGELCWSYSSTSTSACPSAPSGSTTYGYDSNGNLTSVSGSPGTTLTWDGKDQLTSYDSGSADLSAAVYDGDGLRTDLVYGDALAQDFTWDTVSASVPELISDMYTAYVYGAGGTPVEQVDLSTGDVTYLVADALGSVRGVVAQSGSLTASTAYDAWGNPETSGGLTSGTPFGYAGGYTDATGLIYLEARYYDPTTGQFLSVDPDLQQTGQAYAYAGDDPVDSTDPSGRASYPFGQGCTGLCSAAAVDIDPPSPFTVLEQAASDVAQIAVPAVPDAVDAYEDEYRCGEQGDQWSLHCLSYGAQGAAYIVSVAGPPDSDAAAAPLAMAANDAERETVAAGRATVAAEDGSLQVVGSGFSASEQSAAEALAAQGRNVVLREATGVGRTSDLLVDGVPYDVYTPTTGNLDRIVSAIASKGSQVNGGGVVLDLSKSPLSGVDPAALLARVQGVTPNISNIIILGG